jgi:predicted GNAT family N-acyltransferase
MIEFRLAQSEEERATSFHIRYEVFQQELGYKQSEDVDTNDDHGGCIVGLASYNQEVVATIRGRESRNGYRIERLCVLKSHRGLGIGNQLMRWFMDAVAVNNQGISIGAPLNLVSYFEPLGFKVKGKSSYWEGGIIHHYMKYMQ